MTDSTNALRQRWSDAGYVAQREPELRTLLTAQAISGPIDLRGLPVPGEVGPLRDAWLKDATLTDVDLPSPT